MKLKAWTDQSRGRQAALAEFLKVPAPNVSLWVSGKKTPSHRAAVLIEKFTGGEVTRKDIFPCDWQEIWPELQQATASQPCAAA